MQDYKDEKFWKSYSEDHFWRLNDKTQVKQNSIYYDGIYDSLIPANKSIKILDAGCGGGHFLHYLKRKGYQDITGVDITPGLVEFVKKEIHPNVIQSDIFSYLGEINNLYDLIVANDLIEHLPKEKIILFLSSCYQALKPGGLFIMKTPNMGHIFAARYRYIDFTHTIGFTETSLHEVLAASDFKDIKLFSEFHTRPEPRAYWFIRKIYQWLKEDPPRILSTNIISTSRK